MRRGTVSFDDDLASTGWPRFVNKLDLENDDKLRNFTAQFNVIHMLCKNKRQYYEDIIAPVDKVINNPGLCAAKE